MCSRIWLVAAVAVCVVISACSEFNTNLTLQTSSSSLTYLSPGAVTLASVPAGGLPITATGNGFVTGAFILWNGVPLSTTTFVNSTQLTATVPASNFTTPGPVQVAVQIPGSAVAGSSSTNATTTTEVSNIIIFTVSPAPGPPPTISSLSAPSSSLPSAPYCSTSGFTLTVNGTNFAADSVVTWNGLQRATTVVSSTQLTASISAADAAFPGAVGVSVTNSSGTSNTMPFTLTNPTTSLPPPSIISLTPTSTTAGAAGFTLTVTGSSFVPCSVVRWDGSAKNTTFVSSTQLNATIPATDIFTAGPGGTQRTVNVTVFTLSPGGGTSGAMTFTINP